MPKVPREGAGDGQGHARANKAGMRARPRRSPAAPAPHPWPAAPGDEGPGTCKEDVLLGEKGTLPQGEPSPLLPWEGRLSTGTDGDTQQAKEASEEAI